MFLRIVAVCKLIAPAPNVLTPTNWDHTGGYILVHGYKKTRSRELSAFRNVCIHVPVSRVGDDERTNSYIRGNIELMVNDGLLSQTL